MSETRILEMKRFLMARYAEDEAAAREAKAYDDPGRWEASEDAPYVEVLGQFDRPYPVSVPPDPLSGDWFQVAGWDEGMPYAGEEAPVARHIARHDPARVIADCHVNRSIVEFATSAGAPWSPLPKGSPVGLNLLAILAEPFADHPDYRPEWRP